jgi:cellulose synthase (UDP-forming)
LGGGRGKKDPPKSRLLTSIVPVILLGLLAGISGRDVRAAQADHVAVPPVRAGTAGSAQNASPSAGATFDSVFTLSNAGVPSAIGLHGVDASHSISFSVARNRLVKTATMKLRYHLSPGLLPGVSQLNVSLNGTMFASLAAGANPSSGDQTGLLEATVDLPTDLLVHDNQLTFQFVGHYTTPCEDPSNSTLWAQVDPNSTIELAGTFLPLTNDLSLLPLPFYDSGVNPHPVVPIVFLAPPSPKAMQAAGIVASWFGILNGHRPVRFPVSLGAIPAGNTVVIAEDAMQIPASLGVGAVSGPTVAMVTNPSDPSSNVLLVAGSNEEELLTAASALVLHGDTWQGQRVSIQDFAPPAPRKVDDAPRWLSTDKSQPANLGEIAQTGDLQGDGSVPLAVYMRIPPDLYFGERQNLPFHLSYRYDGVPLGAGSTLQVRMTGAYVSSTPLPHQDKASMVLETVVPVPVVDLRPFSNTLLLNFAFQPAKDGNCAAGMPANLQGAVLKDSTLDITGIPHWTKLPNLELFANAGYPFTRKADLAETAVVLPNQPSAGELEIFLTMMGHFGAQTGYPVLGVTVTDTAGMSRDGHRDYLVIGTVDDQPALQALDRWLPVGVNGGGLQVRDLHGLFDRFASWRAGSSGAATSGLLETAGGLPDALMEGIEWPSGSKRSVVVVIVRDEAAISSFLSAFLRSSQSSDISQSVSVLHGAQFSSYQIGGAAFWSGELSPGMHAVLIFQRFPWLITIVALIFCFLMAVLIQARLRRRARERLQGGELQDRD